MDFTAFRITDVKDLCGLHYNKDGRPRRYAETQTAAWAEKARFVGQLRPSILERLSDSISNCISIAESMEGPDPTNHPDSKAPRNLFNALLNIKAATGTLDSFLGSSMMEEVGAYVEETDLEEKLEKSRRRYDEQ